MVRLLRERHPPCHDADGGHRPEAPRRDARRSLAQVSRKQGSGSKKVHTTNGGAATLGCPP